MYIQNKTDYGYIRVASAVPSVNVADVDFNVKSILSSIEQAKQCDAQMLALPELCVTAYTCADLFGNEQLLDASANSAIHYQFRYRSVYWRATSL